MQSASYTEIRKYGMDFKERSQPPAGAKVYRASWENENSIEISGGKEPDSRLDL